MKINSELLRKRLNNQELIDWIDEDKSPQHYKQGYLSGLIKALVVLGEVEYFTEHGKDRDPIDFEFSEDAIKGLTAVTGAVSDKIKELELASHSEKDIVEQCIQLMEEVHAHMMEYMEFMDVEHTEGIPRFRYSYVEIVQRLLLSRTRHGGGTSTREKCRQLGIDPYGEIIIGEGEE
ncbi:hypothetical protein Amet_2590 [Alkaliphilus metalliredigens QYMF]|uniref:Uncharacterized protein n=1 Tax=Alkaliphilus metalliredigens (strain QYMF) TaxID=293826 RepID=A6TRC4_ALKMQ|nr:hypothetical protein [Alkaliphilus metalliredigens]ABR48742.1 hypothetical protein Amet_2590 [Alkaliphilus metalliredigens QYMF]